MEKDSLVVLIREDSPASGDTLGEALREGQFRVQSVERVATALARIDGGGVDAVVLDISTFHAPQSEVLDQLLKLRSSAPGVPIIVVYGPQGDGPLMRLVKTGAAEFIPQDRCQSDLAKTVRLTLKPRVVEVKSMPFVAAKRPKAGKIVAFFGAKGGVGTTTVAVNTACALARQGSVALTELCPTFGTLGQYFHSFQSVHNYGPLLDTPSQALTAARIEACLWPYKKIAGLNILFGPQIFEQCREIEASFANAISRTLYNLADYVVIDLPSSLSAANKAVVQDSDVVVLVVERDSFCVESGRQMLTALRSWRSDLEICSVVVNRSSLALPLELKDIEIRLGIPTAGVVPPAADLCIAARNAGTPLVQFEPDSIAAQSFVDLAEMLVAQY